MRCHDWSPTQTSASNPAACWAGANSWRLGWMRSMLPRWLGAGCFQLQRWHLHRYAELVFPLLCVSYTAVLPIDFVFSRWKATMLRFIVVWHDICAPANKQCGTALLLYSSAILITVPVTLWDLQLWLLPYPGIALTWPQNTNVVLTITCLLEAVCSSTVPSAWTPRFPPVSQNYQAQNRSRPAGASSIKQVWISDDNCVFKTERGSILNCYLVLQPQHLLLPQLTGLKPLWLKKGSYTGPGCGHRSSAWQGFAFLSTSDAWLLPWYKHILHLCHLLHCIHHGFENAFFYLKQQAADWI